MAKNFTGIVAGFKKTIKQCEARMSQLETKAALAAETAAKAEREITEARAEFLQTNNLMGKLKELVGE